MNIKIRGAISSDIKDIKKLLSFYCLETENLDKNLSESIVAVFEDKIVGCACLDIDKIVELRSIAVLPNYRNKGIGSKLIEVILKRAYKITDIVYLRTTSPVFFEKKGAKRHENSNKKVLWKDCNECDMFDICKQVMMSIRLKP